MVRLNVLKQAVFGITIILLFTIQVITGFSVNADTTGVDDFILKLNSRTGLYHVNENPAYIKWLEDLILEYRDILCLRNKAGEPVIFNLIENQQCSPFLLEFLDRNNIDLTVRDDGGNNFIHYTINYYVKFPELASALKINYIPQVIFLSRHGKYGPLLRQRNNAGFNPVEWAWVAGLFGKTMRGRIAFPFEKTGTLFRNTADRLASIAGRKKYGNGIQFRLIEACFSDNTLLASAAIDGGAEINTAAVYGISAIHLAGAKGNSRMVRFLLEKGADVDKAMAYNLTAVFLSSLNGYPETAELLLEKGADANIACQLTGDTLFHLACKQNPASREWIDILLKYGADINRLNNLNESPLGTFMPFSRDKLEIPFFLLKNGAKAAADKYKNILPICSAAATGSRQFVEAVFASGEKCKRTWKDFKDWGPENFTSADEYLDMLELFIKHGADINSVSRDWLDPGTLLYKAFFVYEDTDLAGKLIRMGANLKIRDMWGMSLLHRAVIHGRVDLADFFIRKKLNVNLGTCRDIFLTGRKTKGNIKCMADFQWILGTGNGKKLLTVTKLIPRGSTPLHLACLKYDDAMTAMLLSRKANPHKKNAYGKTPLGLLKTETNHLFSVADTEDSLLFNYIVSEKEKFMKKWKSRLH
ncbi:MAG: ankyrin repeat domain-containing protein [Spirochaetales bacterium]|nr:ankyrin repeat domain-containing protein [Spirochaetales bacterium]